MATQDELSEYLLLTPRQIRNLQVKGIIAKPKGRGSYDLKQSVNGYVTYLRSLKALPEPEDDLPPGGDGQERSLNDEDRRLKRLRADTLELNLEIARKRYAPIQMMVDVLTNFSAAASSMMDAWVPKIKKAQPTLRPSALQVVERDIVKMKDALANIHLDLSSYAASDEEWDNEGVAAAQDAAADDGGGMGR